MPKHQRVVALISGEVDGQILSSPAALSPRGGFALPSLQLLGWKTSGLRFPNELGLNEGVASSEQIGVLWGRQLS